MVSMFSLCFVLVLVIRSTVLCLDCPVGTAKVPDCSEGDTAAIGTALEYRINFDDVLANRVICPRSDSSLSWKITLFLNTNDDSPISTGIYCSHDNVSYASSEICMDDDGTVHIQSSSLTMDKDDGLLNLTFISPVLNVTVPIRYGIAGIYPFDGTAVKTVNEGDPFTFSFVIFTDSSRTIKVFFDGSQFQESFEDLRCIPNTQDMSQVITVSLSKVSLADSGNYTAVDSSDSSFQGTITLNVIPDPMSPPASTLTTSSAPSSISPDNTPTQQPSSTGTATASVTPTSTIPTQPGAFTGAIVWVVVGVGVFFAIAIFIVLLVLIGICCYANRRSSRSNTSSPIDNGHAHMPQGSPTRPVKGDFKARHSSTSSERPLTKGGSTPSVHSSHDTTTNYTAVYCSTEYTQCGVLLKEKHGDLIHIIDSVEDVRLSLVQPHCTDILLFTDPSDAVFKEIMSCGVDPLRPDSRNKLRIIKFVSVDSAPCNTVGVNGFRFVLVEGEPDLSTLLTAIGKAEYPELVKESGRESHRHDSVASSSSKTYEQHKPPMSPDHHIKTTNKLLQTLVDIEHKKMEGQSRGLELQEENIELNRQRNELMEQGMVKEESTRDSLV